MVSKNRLASTALKCCGSSEAGWWRPTTLIPNPGLACFCVPGITLQIRAPDLASKWDDETASGRRQRRLSLLHWSDAGSPHPPYPPQSPPITVWTAQHLPRGCSFDGHARNSCCQLSSDVLIRRCRREVTMMMMMDMHMLRRPETLKVLHMHEIFLSSYR